MKYLILLLLLPMNLLAQDVTGIWTGFINSGESKLPYEVVITQNGNQLHGYALIVFSFNGIENIGVKSLEVSVKKGKYHIEDGELLYDNYTTAARRVKVIMTLELNKKNSQLEMSGSFTTRTRDMRSLATKPFTGTVELQKRVTDNQFKIVRVLHELDLLASLSFLEQPERISIAAIPDERQETKTELKEQTVKPVENIPQEVTNKPKDDSKIAAKENTIKPLEKVSPNVATQQKQNVTVAPKENTTKPIENVAKNVTVQPKTDVKSAPKENAVKPADNVVQNASARPKEIENKELVKSITVKDLPEKKLPAKEVVIVTEIPFRSDSIFFTLYDNGEVDGDTVSVFLNGKLLMDKIRLTASGTRQKIFLPAELGDSILVVMHAENLGVIPPNSGLLIIHDGAQRYNVRFIGDNVKNSAIVLRRKR